MSALISSLGLFDPERATVVSYLLMVHFNEYDAVEDIAYPRVYWIIYSTSTESVCQYLDTLSSTTWQ